MCRGIRQEKQKERESESKTRERAEGQPETGHGLAKTGQVSSPQRAGIGEQQLSVREERSGVISRGREFIITIMKE